MRTSGFRMGSLRSPLAERLGVPLVTTEHDSSATARLALPGMREAYLPLLQEGRALLAVSQSLRDRLAIALEVDPARIGVVPNVVDVDAFASGLDTVARDAGELLWVGGRKAGKGIDVLLAAFARLQASRPDLRLRLIGRAPSETEEAAVPGTGARPRHRRCRGVRRAGLAFRGRRCDGPCHRVRPSEPDGDVRGGGGRGAGGRPARGRHTVGRGGGGRWP